MTEQFFSTLNKIIQYQFLGVNLEKKKKERKKEKRAL